MQADRLYRIGNDAAKKFGFGGYMGYPVTYDFLFTLDGGYAQDYFLDKVTLCISFDYDEERFREDLKFKESEFKKWGGIEKLAFDLVSETSTSYKYSSCSMGKIVIQGDKINVKKMLAAIEEKIDIKSYTVAYGEVFTDSFIRAWFPVEGFTVRHINEVTGKYNSDPIDFFNYVASGNAPEASYGVVYDAQYAKENVLGEPYDVNKLPTYNEQLFYTEKSDVRYVEVTPENALEIYNKLKASSCIKEYSTFCFAIPEEQTAKAQIDLFLDIYEKCEIRPFMGIHNDIGESILTGIEISSEDIIDGDANNDKKLTIADSAAILQSLANADKYGLSLIGELNADVYEPGSGISGLDALRVQEMVASNGEV